MTNNVLKNGWWIQAQISAGQRWTYYVQSSFSGINSLPHNQVLDFSELKAVADHALNVAQITKFAFDRVK